MSYSTNRLDELDRVGFDPTTETYHNQHDWEDADPLYLTVVETVSAVNGREPTTMDPLYSVLDPDALEALLSSSRAGDVQLSFTFEGCLVTLSSSGDVVVEPEK